MDAGDSIKITKCENGYLVEYFDIVDRAKEVFLDMDALFRELYSHFGHKETQPR